uniref:SH3 domain-containing protein 19-like n=1 Tax=Echeneis naucrates TaxID=173247 RepID=A0A665TN12_ECHNA
MEVGPRCVALFDYDGEEEDELTFSQGDVIALHELIGPEWGRGQIHGRLGIFPLSFTEVVESLPQPASSPEETTKTPSLETRLIETSGELKSRVHFRGLTCVCKTFISRIKNFVLNRNKEPTRAKAEEWAVAVFDFPGQTEEDLSFQKGALIQVIEHVDADWRRGRLEGREAFPVPVFLFFFFWEYLHFLMLVV